MAPRLGNVMCIPAPPWCANEIYPAAVREAFRVNLRYWGEPTRGGQFGDREHQRQLSVRPAEPKTSTGASITGATLVGAAVKKSVLLRS